MAELLVHLPRKTVRDLEEAVFGSETTSGLLLELVISIQDNGLILRDFAAYLRVIDGFYGQLQTTGYLSYAHQPHQQLRISEIKQGSLDFIIQEIFSAATNPYLIVVWLALKYLPNVIKASADVARAYRTLKKVA
jgi:hypothetical protein